MFKREKLTMGQQLTIMMLVILSITTIVVGIVNYTISKDELLTTTKNRLADGNFTPFKTSRDQNLTPIDSFKS